MIDVAKDGASIVEKYEAEVQAEVTEFLEEGVRVVLVPAPRGNLRSVKKVPQGGINVLFSSWLSEWQGCCRNFSKPLRHGSPGIVGRVIRWCGTIWRKANSVGFAENASMELVKELGVMKKKSEVFDDFQDHEAMATVQFDKRISKLTVDHGREYKERITVERVLNGVERLLPYCACS